MTATLRERLGYTFRQPDLLRHALTHRSHGASHNERLEFVGDAVLNCVVGVDALRALPGTARRRSVARARVRSSTRTRWRAWRARSGSATRDQARRGRAEERRHRPPVDPRRCARGGVRRGVRRRRLRRGALGHRRLLRRRAGAAPIRRRWARIPRRGCRNGCRRGASPCPEYAVIATHRRSARAAVRRRMPNSRAGHRRHRRAAAAGARPSRLPRKSPRRMRRRRANRESRVATR